MCVRTKKNTCSQQIQAGGTSAKQGGLAEKKESQKKERWFSGTRTRDKEGKQDTRTSQAGNMVVRMLVGGRKGKEDRGEG